MSRRTHALAGVLARSVAGPLFIVCVLAIPATAASHNAAHLDQEQATFAGGLSVRAGPTQTVTVGRSGLLVRVDVPLCSAIKGSIITLTVAGGDRHRPARSTASITLRESRSNCVWHAFPLRRPLAARRSGVVRLALAVQRGAAPLWASNAYGGDPYRGGVGRWMGHTVNDFAFRTYVQT